MVEPDAIRERFVWRQVVEGRDLVPFLVEVPDDMAANETR